MLILKDNKYSLGSYLLLIRKIWRSLEIVYSLRLKDIEQCLILIYYFMNHIERKKLKKFIKIFRGDEMIENIVLNSIYNIDGIELLEKIYEEFGNESIDMILLDLP